MTDRKWETRTVAKWNQHGGSVKIVQNGDSISVQYSVMISSCRQGKMGTGPWPNKKKTLTTKFE